MISKTPIEGFNKKFDVVSIFIEHKGKILLLHRHDDKPQGNTWGVIAGKAEAGEGILPALIREIKEEIGLDFNANQCEYLDSYYVRYPTFDFMYYVYRSVLKEIPVVNLNKNEHKDYRWLSPKEALDLHLIQDEDSCIKWTYGLN